MEEMDKNSVHTSVVIEVANKAEPEEQKSYSIDVDDLNIPKDYVIDQIFCGENVTVYALFEVPETENNNFEKNLVEITSSNIDHDSRFYYKNTFKGVSKDKKSSGYPQNSSGMSSEEISTFFSDTNRKGSFYCLKHPSRNYDLLTPERKKSDLKLLYSKDFSSENSKSTRFKAISVGVNTDIVQSPRIIEEAHKALGINIPMFQFKEKDVDVTNPSSKPSCEVTDLETRPSFSSLASSLGSKNRTLNSISNFFFVPLFMMDDKTKLTKINNAEKNIEEEKFSCPKILVTSAVNTDFGEFTSRFDPDEKKEDLQDNLHSDGPKNVFKTLDIQQQDENLIGRLKLGEKKSILEEIKLMQLKLNSLIKVIESDNNKLNEKDDEPIQLGSKMAENSNSKMKIFQSDDEPYSNENPTLLNCETEEDVIKKSSSKLSLLAPSEEINIREDLGLKSTIPDEIKNNYHEDEERPKSVKSVKSTGSLPSTTFSKIAEKPYFDTNFTPPDDLLLSPKKSLCSLTKETLIPDKIAETDKKTCSDSEKPPTPNQSLRKIITTNSNMKKDIKTIKKKNNRIKIGDLGSRTEIISKKLTTNTRKLVRGNAESRLHIDKLMKPVNIKTPQSLRSINEEKPGPKGDRVYRPSSQKLDNKEVINEIGINKETESKLLFKKSLPGHIENPLKKHTTVSPKLNVEPVGSIENAKDTSAKEIPLHSNPPVVVELLSKKPKLMKDYYSDMSHDDVNSDKISVEEDIPNNEMFVRKSRSQMKQNEDLDIMKKSIVKSVWALTKVLFYEDGTKKLEVLEASLNPPGYSLNQTTKSTKQLENLNLVKNI